jgi:hypothetical protein
VPSCFVCEHPQRHLIEARIRSGEPLLEILVDHPYALAYHKRVCMDGLTWDVRKTWIECSDRFPLCLNNAPIVMRYNTSYPRMGVTRFRQRDPPRPILRRTSPPSIPDKTFPGLLMELASGKESSTSYSRLRHSTKCNGWSRRFSEDEWRKLFDSIIRPFSPEELEELVYGTADLDDRELKDSNPKRTAYIWDTTSPHYGSPVFFARVPSDKKEPRHLTSLMEYLYARHERRLWERSERYKANILRPLLCAGDAHAYHDRVNSEYWRYNLAHRFGTYGKNKIAKEYYKYPAYHTFDGDVCQLENPFKTYKVWPFPGRWWEKHADVIYTPKIAPGDIKFRAPRPGPQERPWFAQLNLVDKDGSIPSSQAFSGAMARIIAPPSIPSQESMVSGHINRIGQALSTQYKHRRRFYLRPTCDCGGLLRYSNRGEVVCDSCQAAYEYLDHSEFMNTEYGEESEDEYELPDFYAEEERTHTGRVNQEQNVMWVNEASRWQTQGIKLNVIARTINKRDILWKQIGRVCAELGCTIQQLKQSTVLQHRFRTKWYELYNEQISKQNLATKIAFF